MSDEEKMREEEVFNQKLEMDELEASGGWNWNCLDESHCRAVAQADCSLDEKRPIYGPSGEFPRCAATVESDSCCASNDACYSMSVKYQGMTTDCNRSWR